MKDIIRIVGYVRAYMSYAVLNIVFNLLSIVFNVFSLGMRCPFLGLLFGQQELVTVKPPLALNVDSLLGNFFYQLSSVIAPSGEITPEGQVNGLIFICVLVIVLFFLKNLFRYLALYFMSPIRYGVVRDIRDELYAKLLTLPLSYFSEKRKGDIISRMTTDILEIEVSIMNSLEVVFKEPLTIAAYLGAMIFMSPELTLFVFILLPLSGYLIGIIGKSLKRTSSKGQERIGRVISVIEETLTGIRIIKAFTAEKKTKDRFDEENNSAMKLFVRMLRKRDLSSPMSEFMGVVVMVVIIWFGGQLVLDVENPMDAKLFITYLFFFSQIISPSKSFATAYYNVQKGAASLDRVQVIMDAEEKIVEKPNAASITSFEKEIEFKNVSFAYNETPTLKNISLIIPKGKTIALIGQSGGGKTTIANMLPRFYDLNEGDLLIDGVSVKDFKLNDLRKLMGIVTQESILFNDTVSNNIAFGIENPDEEKVIASAKIANAHDFIMELEDGYQTNIGDGGNKLSGGQRQRLSIARAILKNPPILILDEATSSLDSESEKMVQDAIFKLMKDRTSLVIAHRLSTILKADEIVVIQEGEIVEQGTHESLMAKNGAYKKLYVLQTFA